MKSRLLILCVVLGLCQIILAQRPEDRQQRAEEMKADKIEFITKHVGFTANEAALFWTQYNEFEDEMADLFRTEKKVKRQITEESKENDYDNALQTIMETERKALDLKMKYYDKYQKILSSKKLFLYYQAEKEYRRFLLDKIAHKKNPAHQNDEPGPPHK